MMASMIIGFSLAGVSSSFVIPILSQIRVGGKLFSRLALESALTDVFCIVATLSVIEVYITGIFGVQKTLTYLIELFAIAGFIGVLGGIIWIVIRVFEEQNYIITIAYLILIYLATEYFGGNGPIAALFLGLILNNSKQLSSIKEGILSRSVAEKQKAMGFCVYNNIAVGAYYLLEKYNLKKVAIIDFDVHHGNGTQNIFYDNEKVLYISSHQYPYYPGSGAANEKGNKDNVLNVPLSAGTQSHEFLNAYDSIFKKLKAFKPEFILLSAGFDAHKDDPLAQINLESKDYYTLTKRILTLAKELCDGKVVSILEGGYDLNALKESVDYHVKSLLE